MIQKFHFTELLDFIHVNKPDQKIQIGPDHMRNLRYLKDGCGRFILEGEPQRLLGILVEVVPEECFTLVYTFKSGETYKTHLHLDSMLASKP